MEGLARVKMALVYRKKSQRELAREIGMHEVTLSDILRGRLIPTQREKERIARALRLPVDRLFSTLTTQEASGLFFGSEKSEELYRNRKSRRGI